MQARLAEFNQGSPPTGQQFLLLCEDHNGTYTLPFRCEWRDGAWYGVEKRCHVVGDNGGPNLFKKNKPTSERASVDEGRASYGIRVWPSLSLHTNLPIVRLGSVPR